MTVFRPGGLRSPDSIADGAAELIREMMDGNLMPEQVREATKALKEASAVILAKYAIDNKTTSGKAPVAPVGASVDINRLFEAAAVMGAQAGGRALPMNDEPADEAIELRILDAAYAE